jgi:hypothetical protein
MTSANNAKTSGFDDRAEDEVTLRGSGCCTGGAERDRFPAAT